MLVSTLVRFSEHLHEYPERQVKAGFALQIFMAKETAMNLPSGITELVIPAALMNAKKYPRLRYSAVLLYAILRALPKQVNQSDGQEYLEMSATEIQEILGCKESALRINLNALRSAGLIESYKPRFASVLRYIVKEAA